jgi:ubiquitin-like 1-activating enzyme E1 A
LAGIRAVICDGRSYPESMASTPCSFLPPDERSVAAGADLENAVDDSESQAKRVRRLTVASAMQSPVTELNPLIHPCEINELHPLDSIDDGYFADFDVVVASNIGMKQATRISKAVTAAGHKFFLVDTFGWYAVAVLDLGKQHTFRKEVGKDKLSDELNIQPYTAMEDIARASLCNATDRWYKDGPPKIWAKYRSILHYRDSKAESSTNGGIEDFIECTRVFLTTSGLKDPNYLGTDQDLKDLAYTASAEMSPVCAVMGGIIGNEVIKAITGKGEPANNILLFDGMDGSCQNFTILA